MIYWLFLKCPYINADCKFIVGKTAIEVKTPFEGWKEISLQMLSDWKITVDLIFKRESRLSKIYLEQHGLYDYNISVETPYSGYEKVFYDQ